MKSSFALLAVVPLFVVLTACDQKTDATANNAPPAAQSRTNAATADADNTQRNERDRDGGTVTPLDQGNTDADRGITRKIRQALVNNTNNVAGTNNYSVTAKNIKIITANGKVTLRGPVNSVDEKKGIAALAAEVAGQGNVDDQLEVKSNP